MRFALILALALLAGCLEERPENTDGPDPTRPPAALTPTPAPTPAATPATPTTPATPPPADTTPPGTTPSPTPGEVRFRVLGQGQQGGPEAPERGAYASEEKWAAASRRYPPVESPDLSRETVVAVAAGQRPNGCWGIAVTDAARQADGTVVVQVTTYEPSPDAFCTEVVTYPWHVVALDAADALVRFEERRATYGAS